MHVLASISCDGFSKFVVRSARGGIGSRQRSRSCCSVVNACDLTVKCKQYKFGVFSGKDSELHESRVGSLIAHLQQHGEGRLCGIRGMTSGVGADAAPVLFANPRQVLRTLLSKEQPEGDGATVRRSIGRPEMKTLDPFLLLDHFAVSPPAGFPDHPHRGFETVTYMIEGKFTHQDFAGHSGTIGPGDLQWMTAGRGIVHCELPAAKGVQTGLQLWVNLAAKDKMVDPNYQELEDRDIPKVEKDGVRVSVIAGESYGVKSPVYTRTPTMYLDFTVMPGARVVQAVPEGWNAFLYILEGQSSFGAEDASQIGAFHTVQLGPGDGLYVWNKSGGVCRFVLIGGQPLNEPVVQHGPFVMNTREEIVQAITDYRLGRNGFERASGWQSSSVVFA